MPIDEEDKDVIVTLDDPADAKTPEEIAAEKAIDDLKAADKAGQPEPTKDKPADKPLTAEEGKDDLAAQLKAMSDTAAAERKAREAAEATARDAQEAAKRSQGDAFTQRANVIAGAIETVSLEQKQATSALEAALEAGDYKTVAATQVQIAETAAKLVRLQEAKSVMDAQKGKPAPAHEGRVERPPESRAQDAFEEMVSSLTPKSQAWVRRNPECFTDKKLYHKTMSAHQAALADDIETDTPEYFAFLEERIGLRQKPAANDPQPTTTSRAPAARTSAPPNRDTGGNGSRLQGNKITLSAAEREAARMSGLTDQEYATQLIKLERSGELSHAAR